MNLCDDNRIITIEKAKQALIKGTNIEDSPEEMKVLDNILFRCWQMGWLDRYDPQKKQTITEDKIKAWLDMWEGYIDADMIARMKYRVIDIRNVQLSQAATDINVGHKAAGHGSNVPMQTNIPQMPSNTSNALEALDSVNATQFNALDSISRQAAINALERTKRIASYELHGGEVLRTFNVVLNSLINIMSLLPPANSSEIPSSSDTISRQAAIETVMECYDNDELFEVYEDKLRDLPPAQSERIRGRWIPVGGALYQCDQCGVVSLKRKFCSECGADMRER